MRVRDVSIFWNTAYTAEIEELQLVAIREADYGGADVFKFIFSIQDLG